MASPPDPVTLGIQVLVGVSYLALQGWIVVRGALVALRTRTLPGRPVLSAAAAMLFVPMFFLAVLVGLRTIRGDGAVPDSAGTLVAVAVTSVAYFVVCALTNAMASVYAATLTTPNRTSPLACVTYGAVVGVGWASLSHWAFSALGVHDSIFHKLLDGLPNVQDGWSGSTAKLDAMRLAFIGAAISEELVFRGCLQPWLDAKTHGRHHGSWAILATSAAFAAIHVANTDHAAAKLVQTLLIGCAHGVLMRVFGLRAAMTAHVVGNIAVLSL